MGWWKADPIPDEPKPTSTPPSQPIQPSPHPQSSSSESSCPVDPKTRSIWLQQAQKNAQSTQQLPPSHPPIPNSQPKTTNPTSVLSTAKDCSSDRIDQSPSRPNPTDPSSKIPVRLSHDRVISSIPRANPSTSPSTPSPSPSRPANAESETGQDTKSGNWIYPSESQFFNAVMRKQTLQTSDPSTLASSISHIIPIHNAVNERAWQLIKSWESPSSPPNQPSPKTPNCSGPKLLSFQGLGAGALSPKARLKSFWGYTEPFDRHDWTIERCDGTQVEYVIDFYQGKMESGKEGHLNFYLDVRPKLNSLEGWRMRGERWVGWR